MLSHHTFLISHPQLDVELVNSKSTYCVCGCLILYSPVLMKRIPRFYKDVSVVLNSDTKKLNLFLDGKSVKTPLGEAFQLPSEPVAHAITTEWKHQGEFVVPNTMPMTTMMMTYIDIDSKIERKSKLDQLNRFLMTDTIRYPHEDPESSLGKEQEAAWKPILELFESRFGIRISQSRGGFSLPPEASTEIQQINEKILTEVRYDGLRLTILETAAKYLKSGSVGIALMEGFVDPETAFKAAFVEEIVQRREWGEVEGDHDLGDAETMLWLHGVDVLNGAIVSD